MKKNIHYRGAIIFRRTLGWALPLLLFMLICSTALGAVSWTVSRRDDAGIIKLVKALEKKVVSRPELKSEPAFFMLKNEVYMVDLDSHMVYGSQVIFVNDPEYSDVATRKLSVFSNAGLPYIGAWILRDGKVIRLKDDAWDVVYGDETRRTEIIFAFPDVKKGDVLGLSIEEEYDVNWGGGYIGIAESLPVMLSRTRIQTKGKIAYRMVGQNLRRDKWSKKIFEKKNEVPNDVMLTVADIPARPTGKYVPQSHEFLPYIMVTFRGIWDQGMRHWRFNVSWNEVAVSGSSFLEFLDENCGQAHALASSLARGFSTPVAKADAIHRYIRDEIVDVSIFEVRDRNREIKDILDSGQATRSEKGILMYTMCRSLGLNPVLYIGRNRDFGDLDKGNPYIDQLTDAVVMLRFEEDRYYVPAEDECPPGVLPYNLRGLEVMALELGLRDDMKEVWGQAFDVGGSHREKTWLAYVDLIKDADLVTWVVLPGDPDAVASSTLETIRYDSKKNEMSVEITGSGFCEIRDIVSSEGDASDHLASYLESRIQSVEVLAATCEGLATSDAPVEISGRVSVDPHPPVMGDTWILPSENVFGIVLLNDWEQDMNTPFQVKRTIDHKYVWRTELPVSWKNFKAKRGLRVNHPYIQYNCRIMVENGELVITRTCRLKRGLLWSKVLEDFAVTVQKIQDFERNPLVLEKKTS